MTKSAFLHESTHAPSLLNQEAMSESLILHEGPACLPPPQIAAQS
jgi:hypothetical protein